MPRDDKQFERLPPSFVDSVLAQNAISPAESAHAMCDEIAGVFNSLRGNNAAIAASRARVQAVWDQLHSLPAEPDADSVRNLEIAFCTLLDTDDNIRRAFQHVLERKMLTILQNALAELTAVSRKRPLLEHEERNLLIVRAQLEALTNRQNSGKDGGSDSMKE